MDINKKKLTSLNESFLKIGEIMTNNNSSNIQKKSSTLVSHNINMNSGNNRHVSHEPDGHYSGTRQTFSNNRIFSDFDSRNTPINHRHIQSTDSEKSFVTTEYPLSRAQSDSSTYTLSRRLSNISSNDSSPSLSQGNSDRVSCEQDHSIDLSISLPKDATVSRLQKMALILESLCCLRRCLTPIKRDAISTLNDQIVESRKKVKEGYNISFRTDSLSNEFNNDLELLKGSYPFFECITISPDGSAYFPFSQNELRSIFHTLADNLDDNKKLQFVTEKIASVFEDIKNDRISPNFYDAIVNKWYGFDTAVTQAKTEAQQFYREFEASDAHTSCTKVVPSGLNKNNNKPEKVLEKLLQMNRGITIGEVHSDTSPKKLLIENMASLKKTGVTKIFLEHLLTDFHSQELNIYFNAPNGTPMPLGLAAHLNTLDNGYHIDCNEHNFFHLVESAKANGIQVEAFDTSASYYSYDPDINHNDEGAKQRYSLMNHLAAKAIENNSESDKNNKWIMLIGSGHLTTLKEIPGVADLTDTPAVIIEDGTSNTVTQGHRTYRDTDITPDVVLTVQTS